MTIAYLLFTSYVEFLVDGGNRGGGGGGGGGGNASKLFVGGLAWATSDDTLRRAFQNYNVTEARVVMQREDPSKSRGFGIVYVIVATVCALFMQVIVISH